MQAKLKCVAEIFEAKNISTDVILPHVKVNSATSKESPEFNDPRYLPFYYRLGNAIQPEFSVQIGSKLGLVGAAFLRSCKSIKEWYICEKNTPNHRMVESNLKLYGCTKIVFQTDLDYDKLDFEKPRLSADIAFLSESFDHKTSDIYLDFLWNCLKPEGLLVVDYIENKTTSESFYKFCVVKNRKPILFKTRYGIGILTR